MTRRHVIIGILVAILVLLALAMAISLGVVFMAVPLTMIPRSS